MTGKQQLFFKELLYGKSGAQAARNAGYSPKSARVSAHQNITKYNEFWLSLLVEARIDIKSLARLLKQGLKSESEDVRYKFLKLALEVSEKVLSAKERNGISVDSVIGTHTKKLLAELEKEDIPCSHSIENQ